MTKFYENANYQLLSIASVIIVACGVICETNKRETILLVKL